MQFLIDGHIRRVAARRAQAADLVAGHLLTPITGYRLCPDSNFAIDNGGFKEPKPEGVAAILHRYRDVKDRCLFVAIPDAIGDYDATLQLWRRYHSIADGWRKAFVIQDGFDGSIPSEADAIFLGGTTKFKDSNFALEIVEILKDSFHCHIGRVNTVRRWHLFNDRGAHTCDGSGVSRYDHMIVDIQESLIC